MLGSLQIPVTEHFAHGFDRDAITQSYRRCESMPGNVES